MADVEMTDAGAAPKVKNIKAGASGDAADGKKKFEVKKVRIPKRIARRETIS
jgi:RING-box protein 1